MCQGNHYQYDQLRRAKHASMMVLYHLHNPNVQAFIHNCNNCQKTIEGEFWRCTEAKCDFDLCKECKKTVTHPHKMELSGGHASQLSSKQRQRSINLHAIAVHASSCFKDDCPSNNCRKMKGLLKHGRECKLRARGVLFVDVYGHCYKSTPVVVVLHMVNVKYHDVKI